jgi:hypothetical protein
VLEVGRLVVVELLESVATIASTIPCDIQGVDPVPLQSDSISPNAAVASSFNDGDIDSGSEVASASDRS